MHLLRETFSNCLISRFGDIQFLSYRLLVYPCTGHTCGLWLHISTLSYTGSYALPICSSVRSNEMKTEVLKNRIRFEVRATIPVLLRTVGNNFMKCLNQCIAIKFTSFEWHNFKEKFNSIHLNLRMRLMFRNGNKNVFVAYLCIIEFSNFL